MGKRSILKSVFMGFICLIFAGLIGFSIYQHRVYKKKIAADIQSSPGPTSDQISNTHTAATVSAELPEYTADITTLESELNATENELDAAYQEMDEKMSREEALKEKELALQREVLSSPSFKKTIRNSVEDRFKFFFQGLDISDEQAEKALEAITERQFERMQLMPDIEMATTEEQKDELRQRWADIRATCESQLEEILGSEYDAYYDEAEMATTRNVIDYFKDTLDDDNQLTESQEKELTEIMYKEQMQVFNEIGYDPRYDLEFDSDVSSGSVAGQALNMAKIHSKTLEKSKGVLSQTQYEQYETYLNKRQGIVALSTQLSK